MNKSALIGAGLFLGGVAVGIAGSYTALEAKFRKQYNESEALLKNAYETAKAFNNTSADIQLDQALEDEKAFQDEIFDEEAIKARVIENLKANSVSLDSTRNAFDEGIEVVQKTNYATAVTATETPVDVFVQGDTTVYGMSYIEEEEYEEDDGRAKEQITIMLQSDMEPVFIMDGDPINDWPARIGDSILVDFYKHVPPGVEPVLYVRNHRTDEDYEVVMVSP